MGTEKVQLLCCPFCGRKPVSMPRSFRVSGPIETDYAVICASCNVALRQLDQETAERLWNTRVAIPTKETP